MDLNIKIDKRNVSGNFQKARFGHTKCKEIALNDIQNEVEEVFYSMNYIYIEYKVMLLSKFKEQKININTNIY